MVEIAAEIVVSVDFGRHVDGPRLFTKGGPHLAVRTGACTA